MKKENSNQITFRIRFGILLVLVFVAGITFIGLFQSKQRAQSSVEAVELFTLIGTQRDGSSASVAGVREQEINISLKSADFERAQKLRLTLLDGKTYEAVKRESEGFVRFADDEFTWQGKISGENNWSGDVVLTVKGKALSGLIYSPKAVYEIIPQENFRHLLVEIDQTRFPACGGGISTTEFKPDNQQNLQNPLDSANKTVSDLFSSKGNSRPELNTQASSNLVDNGSQIDVMIVYTAPVRIALGGATQTQAFAQQAVASTNMAYLNSGIATRLRLVQTMEVNYADNGNGLTGLNWVTNNATVAAARNSSKADLVAILTENATDICGIAWIMQTVSPSFQSSGFSLTQRSCAIGGLTFAHELGHNQASDHNPENANPPSQLAFPYAYGHYNNSGGNFTSVMSYSNFCSGCVRAPIFSNPSITYNGFPTGIANQRENFRVINNTALTISQFRDSGGGGTCPTTPISPNSTINGSLATSDCVFTGTTRYVDLYTFSGTAGQQISISMNSAAFDTYLYLANSSNQTVGEDDDGGGGTNSRIPANSGFLTLPTTGTYTIQATSFGSGGLGAYSLSLVNEAIVPPTTRRRFDFDGDGKTDIGIFRPSNGQWWINRSSNNSTFVQAFGNSADRIAPADFTGDGKADIAIFRASNGQWYVLRSENSTFYAFGFGTNGDIPAPGYFDTDNRADAAVFRPSTSTWYISRSSDNQTIIQQFGANGDVPVIGNYDGDSRDDIAVYRPSTGVWWLLRSSLGVVAYQFGSGTDKPVVGDFTGDGKADAAIWRPSNGQWFVLRSENLTFYGAPYGTNGDIPLSGDFDGDGKNDLAVFRPSNSTWYVNKSTGGAITQGFGIAGDKPVPSAFVP